MKKIIIDPYKTKLRANSFLNCHSLTHLEFFHSVITINNFEFDKYWKLKEITIPDSVLSIIDNPFSACSNLEKLTLPNSLIHSGKHTFDKLTKLKEI